MCPTLLLYGGIDPWIMEDEALAIADQFRGSTEVVKVPGAGHEMPFVHLAPNSELPQLGDFCTWLRRGGYN